MLYLIQIAKLGGFMNYYIGQVLGLLVTAGVILTLQLKKKKQMLTASVIINIMSAANILLLDSFNSGVIVCCVAVFQLVLSLWHEYKKTEITIAEKIIFLILYVAGGALGFETWIDLLCIIAAVFYMLAMLQKKEQHIRLFLLANLSTWIIYHGILGSTAIFAQIAGFISSLIALYRFRKSTTSD